VTTIVTPYSPTKWRLLNHLHHAGSTGLIRRNFRVLLATEDGTPSDLIELDERGLIEAWLGDTQVSLENMTGLFGSNTRVEVSVTAKGRKAVTGTPWIRVLRTIGHDRDGRTIRQIKAEAEVDDDLLKKMDGRGLIEPWPNADGARLEIFRRLPEHCRLRLTDRGREHLPA
jgi:hypothetical protein